MNNNGFSIFGNGSEEGKEKLISSDGGNSASKSGADSQNSPTFLSTRGEELPMLIMPTELSEYSAKFDYPLSDFEARDIAESISETAAFYDLFISSEMIEDSVRICSVLHTDVSLYKGGGLDYSMIEQYSVLQANVHETIDLYMPLLDSEIQIFLGFRRCEDFDDEYKDMLLNIITEMLESNEGVYKEYSHFEAAYLFFAALNVRYKDDLEEYLEYRGKKVKPGHSLSDVADKVFEMYSNFAGGIDGIDGN